MSASEVILSIYAASIIWCAITLFFDARRQIYITLGELLQAICVALMPGWNLVVAAINTSDAIDRAGFMKIKIWQKKPPT